MDDLDISPLRTSLVKRSAREFVEQHFGANDIAAVVYTSGRSDATQDFTNDRSLLLAAIDKFIGRRLQSAAVEALERHYQNELTTGLGRIATTSRSQSDADVKDAAAPINIRDSSASSARSPCSTRCGIWASSWPVSAGAARPCCSSAKGSRCR